MMSRNKKTILFKFRLQKGCLLWKEEIITRMTMATITAIMAIMTIAAITIIITAIVAVTTIIIIAVIMAITQEIAMQITTI